VAGGATESVSRLKAAGIATKAISTRTIRAVMHLDIQADHVSRTVQAVQTLVRESRRRSRSIASA
jgi:hypothetical protein